MRVSKIFGKFWEISINVKILKLEFYLKSTLN